MRKTTKPIVSWVMPVHNGANYIEESIESILNQTYQIWELIIIDDCSKDETLEKVGRFHDKRIRVLPMSRRGGIAQALNIGISESSGPLIARLDADDIALPNRLELQVGFMEKSPETAVLGTWARTIESKQRILHTSSKHESLVLEMLFRNPLFHPTVMIRRNALGDLKRPYRTEYEPSEDFDLWERISKSHRIAVLPKVTTLYRIHDSQASKSGFRKREQADLRIKRRVAKRLGFDLPPASGFRRLTTWAFSQKAILRNQYFFLDSPFFLGPFRHVLTRAFTKHSPTERTEQKGQ